MATTARNGSSVVASSVRARGFMALKTFAGTSTTVSTFATAIEARYRTVAIAHLTISEEMNFGMGAAM
jgi:hypothetical protein